LPKTKDFSGRSLAFVGYNFVHQSTASIRYPFEKSLNNSQFTKTMVSSQSAIQLKEELTSLKQEVSQERTKRIEFEGEVANLNNQKIKLESETKQCKMNQDRTITENLELCKKLEKFESSKTESLHQNSKIQELVSGRARLELDMEQLKVELRSQKEISMRGEMTITELNSNKMTFEKKVTQLNEIINSIINEKDLLQNSITKTDTIIFGKTQEIAEIKNKLELISDELQVCKSEVQSKKEALIATEDLLEKQNAQLNQLEKEKIVLTMDSYKLKGQITELESQNLLLSESGQSQEDGGELREQLDSVTNEKSKLVEEITNLMKSGAILQMEYAMLEKKCLNSQSSNNEAIEKLVAAVSKTSELRNKVEALQNDKKKNEQIISILQSDLARIKSSQDDIDSKTETLEKEVQEKTKLYEELKAQAEQVRIDYQLEIQTSSGLKIKVTEIVQLLEEEKAKRSEIQAEKEILQISSDESNSINARYLTDIESLNKNNNLVVSKLHEELVSTQTNYKLLMLSNASEIDMRVTAEEERDNANLRLEVLKATTKKENAHRHKLEEQITQYHATIIDLEVTIQDERVKYFDIYMKLQATESENELLRSKMGGLAGSSSNENNSKSVDKLSTGAKIGNRLSTLFKSKEALKDSPKFNLESLDENNHKRNISKNSRKSIQSALSRQSQQSHDSLKNALNAMLNTNQPQLSGILLLIRIGFFQSNPRIVWYY
jgi:chromosome segregation ATPase